MPFLARVLRPEGRSRNRGWGGKRKSGTTPCKGNSTAGKANKKGLPWPEDEAHGRRRSRGPNGATEKYRRIAIGSLEQHARQSGGAVALDEELKLGGAR